MRCSSIQPKMFPNTKFNDAKKPSERCLKSLALSLFGMLHLQIPTVACYQRIELLGSGENK